MEKRYKRGLVIYQNGKRKYNITWILGENQ